MVKSNQPSCQTGQDDSLAGEDSTQQGANKQEIQQH